MWLIRESVSYQDSRFNFTVPVTWPVGTMLRFKRGHCVTQIDFENDFKILTESLPQIFWICTPDGNNIYFNQLWADYTGLTLEESHGRGWNKPFHPADQQKAWDAWYNAVNHGAIYSIEGRLRRADGVYRWWHIRGVPVMDEFGAVTRWFGTCTDINELKQALESLRQSEDRLERKVKERTAKLADTLLEQESFSYTVSHDLRAPLRHINSYSAMLIEDYGKDLPEGAHSYLDKICTASSKMGSMIDSLLELSSTSRANLEPKAVNLSELSAQLLEMHRDADSQRSVVTVVAEGVVVWGDVILLRQLLANLFDNAWKYTSKMPTARIEFGVTWVDGKNACFVRDDGAGFDMAQANKLFCAFERLHGKEFHGAGIGLATAQRIVKRHGGSIWAEGRVGEGTTVYFTLPAYH
jgi:PAS domain S-box-containing protein